MTIKESLSSLSAAARRQPLIAPALCLALGIYLGHRLSPPPWLVLAILALTIATAILLSLRKLPSSPAILAGFIAGGIVLMVAQETLIPPEELSNYAPVKDVEIAGNIASPPDDRGGRILFLVKANEIRIDGKTHPVVGTCRATLYYHIKEGEQPPHLSYGDEVSLVGNLRLPQSPSYPGAFDYRLWLLSRGVRSLFTIYSPEGIVSRKEGWGNPILKLAFLFREKGSETLGRLIPGAGGALMRGMVLGDREAIPEEMEEGFRESGVVHILAISGQNLSIIALVLFFILNLLGLTRRKCALIVAPLLIFYALTTGFDPPVMRALVMALVVLGALALFRQVRLLNSLAIAFIVLLLPNPAILFDVGFQLSFAAVAGIVYLYPFFSRIFSRLPKAVAISLVLTTSAQLAVIPILAHHFFRFSIISFLSNLIVVPLSSAAMVLGFITLLLSPAGPLALPASQASWVLSQATVEFGVGFGRIPHASLWVEPPSWLAIGLYYLALLALPMLFRQRWRFFAAICLIGSIGAGVWLALPQPQEPVLRVSFLDISRGDSMLIETPQGKKYLLDGGDDFGGYNQGEMRVAPYLRRLGINHLDGIILSHPNADHDGGLDYILNNFSVGALYDIGYPVDERNFLEMLTALGRSGAGYQRIFPYMKLADTDADLYMTAPIELPPFLPVEGYDDNYINGLSAVFIVEYEGAKFLLTGDREAIPPLPMDWGDWGEAVLKMPHHGSKPENPWEYLAVVDPLLAVITSRRSDNWPSPHTEKALADGDIPYWVTGDVGVITVEVREGKMTVSW